MRVALAERLLIKIMDWSTDEVSKERPLLQALADFKYDEYQQFSPGIRFIESLVLWLKQFDTIDDKKIAYDFFRSQLIFISNAEIFHLLSISFLDIINPILITQAAKAISANPHHVNKIIKSDIYKKTLRKSIFIGLSDGARMDQFRRSAQINNEQVSPTYEISGEKSKDMIKDLNESLGSPSKFNSIFLIDDFTASGISYFRPDESKGKIYKFLSTLFKEDNEETNHLKSLIDTTDVEIHILFYIATETALKSLTEKISEWKIKENKTTKITVTAVQILSDSLKGNILNNTNFVDLIKKYFDKEGIMNSHYKKGIHANPHLGFNECCLPIILSHNTPNNSLPILWMPEDFKYRGLFPRVTRHK